MGIRLLAFRVVGSVGALLLPALASAEPMDPALERLVTNPECRNELGEFQRGRAARCLTDDAAFKKLVNQYGFAFAPTAMHSARTTGLGGFHFSVEAVYTRIDDDAEYFEQGTQGPVDPSTDLASIRNNNPQALLQLYSAKVRKSFGFGLELTGAVGFMPKTSIVSGGADVRLALLEGYRTGLMGILPDVAVGGGVRTITGTPQMQLTVAGVDVQLSKPLPIANASVITPWIGYQYLWIFGDSGMIDLTPATDAIQACNYPGPNVPGNPDPNKTGFDGQPVCNGGSSDDFNNNVVFDNARLERQRIMAGFTYRYEMVMAGAEFITDLFPPGDVQSSDEDGRILEDEDRQWSIVLELGAMF